MPDDSRDTGGYVTGRVGMTSADTVEVSAEMGMACASCGAKCGARQTPQTAVVQARFSNPLKPGQTVMLEAEDGALAQISLSLYLLPALGFLAGTYLAYNFALGDGWQALFALLGLAAGLFVARRLLRRRYTAGTPLCAVQLTDK